MIAVRRMQNGMPVTGTLCNQSHTAWKIMQVCALIIEALMLHNTWWHQQLLCVWGMTH